MTQRRRYKPKTAPVGKVSPERTAWLDAGKWTFSFLERDSAEESEYPEGIPACTMGVRDRTNGKSFFMQLSSLSVQELQELEKFFQYALSELQPICALLDEQAQKAQEAGDDSFGRLYRPVARLITRKRHGIQHPARLPERPENVQGVAGITESCSTDQPGRPSGDVAELDAQPDRSQDNQAALD